MFPYMNERETNWVGAKQTNLLYIHTHTHTHERLHFFQIACRKHIYMHISLARGRDAARQWRWRWRWWWQRNRFCTAAIILLSFFGDHVCMYHICVCVFVASVSVFRFGNHSFCGARHVSHLSARWQCAQRLTNFNHIKNSHTQLNNHVHTHTHKSVFVCQFAKANAVFYGCICVWVRLHLWVKFKFKFTCQLQ